MTHPKDKKEDMHHPAAIRVLGGLYDLVADDTNLEPIFFAMDDFIGEVLSEVDLNAGAGAWRDLFSDHFDRADRLFDVVSNDDRKTPQEFVESQTVPAAVLNQAGSIIAQNADFSGLIAGHTPFSLWDILADNQDRDRLRDLLSLAQSSEQTLVNCQCQSGQNTLSFLVYRDMLLPQPQGDDALFALTAVRANWNADIEYLLQQSFGLTPAELAILRVFVTTGSVAEIAQERGRSIRTVRTQLSQVFARIGVKGQTELAFFLGSLGTLSQNKAGDLCPAKPIAAVAQSIERKVISTAEHRVEYLCYGPRNGMPVLLLQSTHPPALTQALRAALAQAGIRMIAPVKPGSGQTSPRPETQGPDELASDYRRVLDAEGIEQAVIAGQASGGLYALAFAQKYPKRTKAVFLADTGVPFAGFKDILALPKSISRTFIPARYFPEVLKLPHRLVAANFHRSQKDEAKVVEYFFEGSPADRALTRQHAEFYDITRDIIRHSFEDTDRLVQDVARWAGDWRARLDAVATSHRIRFFHGAENTMFQKECIANYVKTTSDCDAAFIAGSGQLAVYEHPKEFATQLADWARAPRPAADPG